MKASGTLQCVPDLPSTCGAGQAMRSPLVAVVLATLLLPAQSQSLPERQAACLSCHGENGQSQNPEVPSLGGEPEDYVTIQLVMFRDKLRVVDIINQVVTDASDDKVRELAGFGAR